MIFLLSLIKSEATDLLKNYVLDDCGYIKNEAHYHENAIKPKNLKSKNIFGNKDSYKDLVIYFTRYHPDKSNNIKSML